MDLITHFLVPFIILSFLKCKNRLAGAFGGISLDFDVFIIWIGILYPELFIFSHRGITHSIIFGFLTSLLFLYIFTREPVKNFISKIIRRDLPIEFNRFSIIAVFFGALTHIFLDSLTSKGIPILYPFTITRFSAEIYYYIDSFTLILALVVLVIIYLKINYRYKKIAMILFITVLLSLGGIRAYEKSIALNEVATFDTEQSLRAYPTPDLFTWYIIKNEDGRNEYELLEYNQMTGISSVNIVNSLLINNGSYPEALYVLKKADELPQVRQFKWNAYVVYIDIDKNSSGWIINYHDLLNTHNFRNNLTVLIN